MEEQISYDSFKRAMQRSQTASHKGIKNEIPEAYLENLGTLYDCFCFIKVWLYNDIFITSGYRCRELNKALGGAPGSKHCVCKAFDFGFYNVSNKSDFYKTYDKIRENFIKYESGIGVSSSEALTKFRNHFLIHPDRLFIHFQID